MASAYAPTKLIEFIGRNDALPADINERMRAHAERAYAAFAKAPGLASLTFIERFDFASGGETLDLSIAAVFTPSFARLNIGHSQDGSLVTDEFDMFIEHDARTPSASRVTILNDQIASHMPIEQRRADAAISETLLAAVDAGNINIVTPGGQTGALRAVGIITADSARGARQRPN